MFNELYVNDELLPEPTGDIKISNSKVKSEGETEAGTTMVIVTRVEKITVKGSWQVTGAWLTKFRTWARADSVAVKCYFPSVDELTEHECQLSVDDETHIKKARAQLNTDGLYAISVTMEEL